MENVGLPMDRCFWGAGAILATKPQKARMTTEKFNDDLQRTRLELNVAISQVMDLVRAGAAFGDTWHTAIERERKAHQTMRWLLDSPLAHIQSGDTSNKSPVSADERSDK